MELASIGWYISLCGCVYVFGVVRGVFVCVCGLSVVVWDESK